MNGAWDVRPLLLLGLAEERGLVEAIALADVVVAAVQEDALPGLDDEVAADLVATAD